MCDIVINGGGPLRGSVILQGSKNSVLPILAASLLTEEKCIIHNCPEISDVFTAFEILRHLGAEVEYADGTASVCASSLCKNAIPEELMIGMRSSVMFAGAILGRCRSAVISNPGGCRLGERPIDIHISSLSKLGAEIRRSGGNFLCELKKTVSGEVTLLYPSVGATENIMLMCAGTGQTVRLYNAAREPEIVDLQNFLNLMGADITGAGSDTIHIRSAKKLYGCEYSVMGDRIAAATFACSAAVCGGDVFIKGAEDVHMRVVLEALRQAGAVTECGGGGIRVISDGRVKPVNMVKTLPYPGFPTDVQPMLGAVLAKGDGVSHLCETVFDSRLGYTAELVKMGANISVKGGTAVITGVEELAGAEVKAMDLRGGAALVVAALAAKGTSVISGTEHIDRGYEKIEKAFAQIGADIRRLL